MARIAIRHREGIHTLIRKLLTVASGLVETGVGDQLITVVRQHLLLHIDVKISRASKVEPETILGECGIGELVPRLYVERVHHAISVSYLELGAYRVVGNAGEYLDVDPGQPAMVDVLYGVVQNNLVVPFLEGSDLGVRTSRNPIEVVRVNGGRMTVILIVRVLNDECAAAKILLWNAEPLVVAI